MIWATRIISLLALSASLPLSEAISPVALDVWAPLVRYPHAGVTWYIGQYHNVTWDNSNPPAEITNPVGSIYLRTNGYTDTDNPLASNINLVENDRTVVRVPDVQPGIYQVVLIGDSGNDSESFTISA